MSRRMWCVDNTQHATHGRDLPRPNSPDASGSRRTGEDAVPALGQGGEAPSQSQTPCTTRQDTEWPVSEADYRAAFHAESLARTALTGTQHG